MNKRIDSLGRIVIPKDYRKKLNINDGELLNIEYENDSIVISKKDIEDKTKKFLNLIINNMSIYFKKNIIFFDISGNIYKSKENIEFDKNIIVKFKTKINNIYYDNNQIFPVYVNGYLYGGLIIIDYEDDLKKQVNAYINLIEKYIEE